MLITSFEGTWFCLFGLSGTHLYTRIGSKILGTGRDRGCFYQQVSDPVLNFAFGNFNFPAKYLPPSEMFCVEKCIKKTSAIFWSQCPWQPPYTSAMEATQNFLSWGTSCDPFVTKQESEFAQKKPKKKQNKTTTTEKTDANPQSLTGNFLIQHGSLDFEGKHFISAQVSERIKLSCLQRHWKIFKIFCVVSDHWEGCYFGGRSQCIEFHSDCWTIQRGVRVEFCWEKTLPLFWLSPLGLHFGYQQSHLNQTFKYKCHL